jgi:hypothetical protein
MTSAITPIFGLILFAVLEASPDMPRKAPSIGGEQHKNSEKASASNKAPSEPRAVTHSVSANNAQDEGQTKTPKDEQKNAPIAVGPVNVQKDRLDKIYIGASVLSLKFVT